MRLTRFLDAVLSSAAKVKILRRLVLDPKPKSGRAIAREVDVSPAQVRLILQELHEEGILHLERVGRSHVYSLRRETLPIKEILVPLFEKERDLPDQIARRIADSVRTHTLSACLFGSVAKGADHAESDLDMAFVVQGKTEERALQDELAGETADKAASLGVTLGPFVITLTEFQRRYRARDPFVCEVVNRGRLVAGLHLTEVLARVSKKAQNSKN